MAERDLRQRYAGSTLGFAWATLHPLLLVAAYGLIFTTIFRARFSPEAPPEQYALYVVAGLLPWIAFSDVAGKATQTMTEHRSLVKHVVFPVQILPLTGIYSTLRAHLVGLAAVLALAWWLRGSLDVAVLLLVPALGLQIVFLAGVSWLLGAVGARFRDVKEVVQVALMIGMFATPIFYVETDLPARVRALIALNPLTHLIRLYRDAILGGGVHSPESYLIFGMFSVLMLFVGFAVFDRTRVFLSDIL